MADQTTPQPKKSDYISKVAGDVTARLEDIKTYFMEIHQIFAAGPSAMVGGKPVCVTETDAAYFKAAAEKCDKMASWYNPESKKKAKVEALKAQLAKLEAELAAG